VLARGCRMGCQQRSRRRRRETGTKLQLERARSCDRRRYDCLIACLFVHVTVNDLCESLFLLLNIQLPHEQPTSAVSPSHSHYIYPPPPSHTHTHTHGSGCNDVFRCRTQRCSESEAHSSTGAVVCCVAVGKRSPRGSRGQHPHPHSRCEIHSSALPKDYVEGRPRSHPWHRCDVVSRAGCRP
jgi:hypothetical protein